MPNISQPERAGNSNIEDGLLTAYLNGAGYALAQIDRALDRCAARPTTTAASSTATTKPCMRCWVTA